MAEEIEETLWTGKWLTARRRGRWEYVARNGDMRAVVILAIDDGDVILIDQFRVPLGRRALELPAGLIGDEGEGDTVEIAARRELEEEAGYRAATIEPLGDFFPSPGMTSENFTLVRATGLTRVSAGGGVDGEDIRVHRVPVVEVPAFVAACRAEGMAVDVKLLVLLGPSILSAAILAG